MILHDENTSLASRCSPAAAKPAPVDPPLSAGAGTITATTDMAVSRIEMLIADWRHPESEYERRHVNYDDGDLRDLPQRPAGSVNRFSGRS